MANMASKVVLIKHIHIRTCVWVMFVICVVLLALGNVQPIQADSPIFVRPGGNDANCNGVADVDYPGSGGPNLNCAKATIGEGVAIVDSAGTVNVAAGIYPESITINKSLTLNGDPGDTAAGPGPNAPVLDGTGFSGQNAIVISAGVSGVTIRGFEIRNYGPSDAARFMKENRAVTRDFSQPITVNPALLRLSASRASAIQAWNNGTSNVTIEDNNLHALGWNAILVGNEGQGLHTGWIVRNNIVGSAAYGIELTNAQNSQVSGNAIVVGPNSWSTGVFINSYNFLGGATSAGANSVSGNAITTSGSTPGTAIVVTAWQQASGSSATLANLNIEQNNLAGNGGAVIAYSADGALIRNVAVTANHITITNPAGSAWYGPYAVHGHSWEGSANSVNGNIITLTGTMATTYYHGINVSGGTTARNWIAVNTNRLNGNHIGSRNIGILLDSTLPTEADISIAGNDVTGFGGGMRIGALDDGVDLAIHHNRIVGNETGMASDTAVNAANNWWGCNAGPVVSPCDRFSGAGSYSPWLILGLNASPVTVFQNGQSALTANITRNSSTQDTSADGYLPDHLTGFFQASVGTVNPAANQTISGIITSTFTAEGVPGSTVISATFDHQTVTNTIEVLSEQPGINKIYLPIITKNTEFSGADLVVQSLTANVHQVEIVLKNIGDEPVQQTQEFWVDFYINPQPAPTAVNHLADDGRCIYGLVWGVPTQELPIYPGETRTLIYSSEAGAPNTYLSVTLSHFPASLPVDTPVYAQVDSANILTTYGAVLEVHEKAGGAYNNIIGPVLSTGR